MLSICQRGQSIDAPLSTKMTNTFSDRVEWPVHWKLGRHPRPSPKSASQPNNCPPPNSFLPVVSSLGKKNYSNFQNQSVNDTMKFRPKKKKLNVRLGIRLLPQLAGTQDGHDPDQTGVIRPNCFAPSARPADNEQSSLLINIIKPFPSSRR